MHCLELAVVALVCNFSAVFAADFANIVRNVNLNARDTFGGSLKARQDYEALIAQELKLPARGLPVQSTVTVTVTTIPEYCSVPPTVPIPTVPGTSLEIQTTPIPAGPATPSPQGPVTPIPTGGLIPYPVASLSSGSPAVSGLPTPIVGANTTVTTSSLSATKSAVSSNVLSLTSTTAPPSAPATSSTSAPSNGGFAKDSNMNGLLLTVVLAFSVNAVLLL